jgi:uncharacterized protein
LTPERAGPGEEPLLTEIHPPQRSVARNAPERPFPTYRYVPGLHPHPFRDRAGHSYHAAVDAKLEYWDATCWRTLPDWLYGVDLFNAFYFWEAHETWERLWSAKRRDSRPALLLQGLIQATAAMLKIHLRSLDGASRLSQQGLEKLGRSARAGRCFMGLDLERTDADLERYFRPLRERTLPPLDASVPVLVLSGESDA